MRQVNQAGAWPAGWAIRPLAGLSAFTNSALTLAR